MQYVLLGLVAFLNAVQSVFQKEYERKCEKPNCFFFSAVVAASALIIFLITSRLDLHFSLAVFWHSLGFGAAYAMCTITFFLAIQCGSLALTTLIYSYSLLVPAVYGLIFLNEKLSVFGIVGIVLFILSLLFIGLKKEKAQFSVKWLIYVVIAFFSNGMCSTTQKIQQMAFNGAYKNEFMIGALAVCVVSLFAASVIAKENLKENLGACLGFGAAYGVSNGILNYIVLILTGLIPNAVLFPSISGGAIVLGFMIAVLIYKERLTRLQMIGYFIGTLSVILLNLN